MNLQVTMLKCKPCDKYVRPFSMECLDDYTDAKATAWTCPDCGEVLGWMVNKGEEKHES
jgi:predicted RNA-binding Zn-ribbon protein involved in translation (DUF1610 family)